jgi:hypothetical protein
MHSEAKTRLRGEASRRVRAATMRLGAMSWIRESDAVTGCESLNREETSQGHEIIYELQNCQWVQISYYFI